MSAYRGFEIDEDFSVWFRGQCLHHADSYAGAKDWIDWALNMADHRPALQVVEA